VTRKLRGRAILLLGLLWLTTPAVAQAQADIRFTIGGGSPHPVDDTALVRQLLTAVRPQARIDAAVALGDSRNPGVISALSQAAVSDSDGRVRRVATESIARIRAATGTGVYVRPTRSVTIDPPPTTVWQQPAPLQPVADPYYALVNSWYQQYLRRTVDPDGLSVWVNMLRNGVAQEEVQASILGSDEYWRQQGGRHSSWIVGLYRDVLGRQPSPQEVRIWDRHLHEYGGDRDRMARIFLSEAANELNNRPGLGYYYPH